MDAPNDHVAQIQAAWRRERPDLDVSPQGIIGRLHRLANHLTSELTHVFEEHGLSEGEFDVLATLRRSGEPFERTPGELSQFTMVTTGAISKRLDKLEAAGHITRERAGDDGRGRIVKLTDSGKALIDAAFTAHIKNEHRLLETLSVNERSQLEQLLHSWLASYDSPLTPNR